MPRLEFNSVQRRTMRSLLGDAGTADVTSSRPPFDRSLPARVREYLEDGIADAAAGVRVRLSKEGLNALDRCEGSFAAILAGERPVWEPSAQSAVGTLLHRALEADAASAEQIEPSALVARAYGDLAADRRFGPFLTGLEATERELLVADARTGIELFRASFPPLGPARRLLAPAAERWLVAELAGGDVILLGRVDLIVGRSERGRPSRVLVDLKTGGAWPEHAQDMRLYALLFTLRFGAPPLRVASFFLRSGECQPEEVTEDLLMRTAERVVGAVNAAARLGPSHDGAPPCDEPSLRPGGWCAWCPRSLTCSASTAG
jgi:RecB family exonuclease